MIIVQLVWGLEDGENTLYWFCFLCDEHSQAADMDVTVVLSVSVFMPRLPHVCCREREGCEGEVAETNTMIKTTKRQKRGAETMRNTLLL